MNKALFSSILGSEKFTKSRLPELMFSGHITIQYMFCMYFMIKKIILEGFNDRGEGNLRGGRGKNFKKTKHNKKNIKTYMYCGFFLDVYWTKTHHILHVGIFLHALSIWNGPRAWGALK